MTIIKICSMGVVFTRKDITLWKDIVPHVFIYTRNFCSVLEDVIVYQQQNRTVILDGVTKDELKLNAEQQRQFNIFVFNAKSTDFKGLVLFSKEAWKFGWHNGSLNDIKRKPNHY